MIRRCRNNRGERCPLALNRGPECLKSIAYHRLRSLGTIAPVPERLPGLVTGRCAGMMWPGVQPDGTNDRVRHARLGEVCGSGG